MPVIRVVVLSLLSVVLLHAAVEPTLSDGKSLYRERRYREARAVFENVAKANPSHHEAMYYIGKIPVIHGQAVTAIPSLEKAIELSPNHPEYYLWLGNAYGMAALEGSIFSQASYARKCRNAYEKAVALDPENINARFKLMTYYRQAPGFLGGGTEKAYAQAREIQKRDSLQGTFAFGVLHANEKRYDEAFAAYRDVLNHDPQNYAASYALGRLSATSGLHLDEGLTALQHCLDLTPEDDDDKHEMVHWFMGNIAEQKRDYALAKKAYSDCLKIDPDFKEAADSLAKLH